jgi:hypothetical protein
MADQETPRAKILRRLAAALVPRSSGTGVRLEEEARRASTAAVIDIEAQSALAFSTRNH